MVIPAAFFIAITALTFVFHAVMIKSSSLKIDPYSGLFFWALGALSAGLLALHLGKAKDLINSSINWSAFAFPLVAGFSIGLGVLGYFIAFNRGIDFSFATPIVNISVVMGGLILGYFLFGESINSYRLAGIILGVFSIFLLTKSF